MRPYKSFIRVTAWFSVLCLCLSAINCAPEEQQLAGQDKFVVPPAPVTEMAVQTCQYNSPQCLTAIGKTALLIRNVLGGIVNSDEVIGMALGTVLVSATGTAVYYGEKVVGQTPNDVVIPVEAFDQHSFDQWAIANVLSPWGLYYDGIGRRISAPAPGQVVSTPTPDQYGLLELFIDREQGFHTLVPDFCEFEGISSKPFCTNLEAAIASLGKMLKNLTKVGSETDTSSQEEQCQLPAKQTRYPIVNYAKLAKRKGMLDPTELFTRNDLDFLLPEGTVARPGSVLTLKVVRGTIGAAYRDPNLWTIWLPAKKNKSGIPQRGFPSKILDVGPDYITFKLSEDADNSSSGELSVYGPDSKVFQNSPRIQIGDSDIAPTYSATGYIVEDIAEFGEKVDATQLASRMKQKVSAGDAIPLERHYNFSPLGTNFGSGNQSFPAFRTVPSSSQSPSTGQGLVLQTKMYIDRPGLVKFKLRAISHVSMFIRINGTWIPAASVIDPNDPYHAIGEVDIPRPAWYDVVVYYAYVPDHFRSYPNISIGIEGRSVSAKDGVARSEGFFTPPMHPTAQQ